MNRELEELTRSVVSLSRSLRTLEARVAVLEGREAAEGGPAASGPPPVSASPAPAEESRNFLTPAGALTLIGRSVLVLGGAFLLRALTDMHVISREIGVALGLIYAVAWIALAYRDGLLQRRSSAGFHGVTAAVIAFPLVLETTTTFPQVTPLAGAAMLAVLAGLALGAALHARLPLLAWVFTLGSLATAWSLALLTRAPVPFAGFGLALGLATVWIGGGRIWCRLRWPAAVSADLLTLLAVVLGTGLAGPARAWHGLDPATLGILAGTLLAVYLGSVAVRTLLRHRDVDLFETVQTGAALLFGLGGLIRVGAEAGTGQPALGVAALAAGGAAYAVAFSFLDRRSASRKNFYYFSWLALVLAVAGSSLLARGLLLAGVLGSLSVAAALLGGTFGRYTLRLHSAVYAASAAIHGGMLAASVSAFLAPAERGWRFVSPTVLLVLATTLAAFVILSFSERRWGLPWYRLVPRFAVGALGVTGLGALAITLSFGALAGAPSGPDSGALGTVRTAVLAGAAVLLAFGGRRMRLFEMVWLVYPVVLLGGLKLLAEDFRHGRPATLFVSLLCYGFALLVASRALKLRRTRKDAGMDPVPAGAGADPEA